MPPAIRKPLYVVGRGNAGEERSNRSPCGFAPFGMLAAFNLPSHCRGIARPQTS